MSQITTVNNPFRLPTGAQVIEFRGNKPFRIYLTIGLILRLSSAGVYVPENLKNIRLSPKSGSKQGM